MPEFILPEADPWADPDDEQEEQEQPADEQEQEKPANVTDYRGATSMGEFLEAYADSGGEVYDYQSDRQHEQAVADRDAHIQEAHEKQREFMANDERLSELKGAKSIAEFMVAYQKAGGVVGDGWTIADDPSTGRLEVYEMG